MLFANVLFKMLFAINARYKIMLFANVLFKMHFAIDVIYRITLFTYVLYKMFSTNALYNYKLKFSNFSVFSVVCF